MSAFVEECLREWRRLGVPDPVANEMAADLTADLEEADSEGGSPEDVLGNNAFDPKAFAAEWAVARGVTGPPTRDLPLIRRPRLAVLLTALVVVFTVCTGSVLLLGDRGSSIAFAIRGIVTRSGAIRFPGRPGPVGPFMGPALAGLSVQALAGVLFFLGIVGLGLIVALYWSPWFGRRRGRRGNGRGSPGWN